ncbi:DUF397 domain-containing protein [Streptomyces sp. V3I7]|uniref:DUF397 domain-containing protein n=1 Tax=Streptomyces sp. V3I7 TaxID=3042278 RepID=UPI00278B3323|nr:DUF397 domain-containing protein [Streptomyces sp. V3I7]MDQ0992875.1 hypothetical protein [Streptomyces sp. V3I7]
MTRKTDLSWFKSSYSSSSEGDSCVEVAETETPATIHVRDSKQTAGPQLALTPEAWAEFVSYVRT